MLVAPLFFSQAQAAQPAVPRSVETLRSQGVRVLIGADGYEPHPPKTGKASEFPWARALDGVDQAPNGIR